MPKFTVRVEVSRVYHRTIEAETKEEAWKKADTDRPPGRGWVKEYEQRYVLGRD